MFAADRQAILSAVADVQRFVARDATILFTQSDNDEPLVRAASEDGSGAERTVAGVRMTSTEFAVTINSLRQVLKFAEGRDLKIREREEHAVITCNRAEHSLPMAAVEDVAEVPEQPRGVSVTLGPAALSVLMLRVRFANACQTEISRWATDAVRVVASPGKLSLTATDASGLATAEASVVCEGTAELLLHRDALSRWAVSSHPSAQSTLRLSPTLAILEAGGVTAWAPAAKGVFPPAEALDLSPGRAIPLPWQLRGVLSLVTPDDPRITLSISRDEIDVTAQAGRSWVPIKRHAGPAVMIPLDGVRLFGALTTFARIGREVMLRYTTEDRPITLVCGEARYTQAPYQFQTPAQQLPARAQSRDGLPGAYPGASCS